MRRFELRLTQLADQDLNDLYLEGLTVWGMVQADRCYDGLLERFEFDRICEHPRMYPAVEDIRAGCLGAVASVGWVQSPGLCLELPVTRA